MLNNFVRIGPSQDVILVGVALMLNIAMKEH